MRALRLCLLLLVVAPAGALDLHPWTRIYRAASPTHMVETNTYPEIAASLRDQLAEAYVLFEDRFGPLLGKARRPMVLRLYRTRDEYMTLGGGIQGAVGHFDPTLDRCAIVWRGEIGTRGWPVAVHEACHQYFRRRFRSLYPPSWYSEGMACWFEGLLDPTVNQSVSRLRIRAAKAARSAGLASLQTVLHGRAKVENGQLRIDGVSPARYYGLAWSFIHFLVTSPKYRQKFRRFELRMFSQRLLPRSRERVVARILESECGPADELEQDWLRHLDALRITAPTRHPSVASWELQAPRPFVRYAALHRLREAPLTAALQPHVIAALDDLDLQVRLAACAALENRLPKEAVPAMISVLDVGDRALRRAGLRALAQPTARAAVPRLLRENVDIELAIRALAAIDDPRSYGLLRHAVTAPHLSPATRARCAAALASDPKATDALREAEEDTAPAVRHAARIALIRHDERQKEAAALRQTHRTAARSRIDDWLTVLRNPFASASEVSLACEALAALRTKRAIADLRRLCRPRIGDPKRLAAVRALVKITGETRGFAPGQSAREREAAFRAWAAR